MKRREREKLRKVERNQKMGEEERKTCIRLRPDLGGDTSDGDLQILPLGTLSGRSLSSVFLPVSLSEAKVPLSFLDPS